MTYQADARLKCVVQMPFAEISAAASRSGAFWQLA